LPVCHLENFTLKVSANEDMARHRERDLETASLRSRKLAHGSSARLERVSPTRESTEYGRVAAKTLLAGDLAPTKGRRRPDVRRGGPIYSTLGKSGKRAPHGSFMLCACFWTIGGDFIEPIDHPGAASAFFD
jgi:hypothetical protein